MCGRYTYTDPARIREMMLRDYGFVIESEVAARYNVAPSQTHPVIVRGADGKPQVSSMRWGLVPFWDKSAKPKIAPINARSEEVFDKPMFKQALQKRRCLVPADGYYEWRRVDKATKIPYFISLKDRKPFCFPGIYETQTELHPPTFALLTTRPNELTRTIHDRMPVIHDGEEGERWLKAAHINRDALNEYCSPIPEEWMQAYPVTTVVNSPANDRSECIIPAAHS